MYPQKQWIENNDFVTEMVGKRLREFELVISALNCWLDMHKWIEIFQFQWNGEKLFYSLNQILQI